MKTKTREQILESLKLAETEEGREGLVAKYLKENPEINKKDEEEKKEVKKNK